MGLVLYDFIFSLIWIIFHDYSSSLCSDLSPWTTIRINSLSGAIRISFFEVFRRINFRSFSESKSRTVLRTLCTNLGISLAKLFPSSDL